MVSPNPGPLTGGVERFCNFLSGVLSDADWEVSIIWPERDCPRSIYRLGGKPLWCSYSAARQLRGRHTDLLITNGFLGAGFPRRVPRIHVYHGTMVGTTISGRAFLPFRECVRRGVGGGLAETVSAANAATVAVSESVVEELRRYYRVRADMLIPNGVDASVFRPSDRVAAKSELGVDPGFPTALYVGRLERAKGVDVLLPACREAGFELLVAGPEPLPGARYLGLLPPKQLAVAYVAVDCVVLPTLYEACSFVILEAMATGVPLVTTAVGWMRSFLRGIPDYRQLITTPDVAALSDRLRWVASNDTGSLAVAARNWVSQHNSLQASSQQWLSLIEGVAGKG